MKTEIIGAATLHLCDCAEIEVPHDLLVTDPPYGQRFESGRSGGRWGLGVLCKVAGWQVNDYVKVDGAIGMDARDALWGLNDFEPYPPFDVIAGLIQEAL